MSKSGFVSFLQKCFIHQDFFFFFFTSFFFQRELEEAWGVKVFDRYSVVLHIFRCNARTKEAKLQISLAEIPLLRLYHGQHFFSLTPKMIPTNPQYFKKCFVSGLVLKMKLQTWISRGENRDILEVQVISLHQSGRPQRAHVCMDV